MAPPAKAFAVVLDPNDNCPNCEDAFATSFQILKAEDTPVNVQVQYSVTVAAMLNILAVSDSMTVKLVGLAGVTLGSTSIKVAAQGCEKGVNTIGIIVITSDFNLY
jgi:hypothetical protein